ncbi:carbohydrate ABC transporter permease [Bifidobacterium simiiventris]|uniref:carbohydrate ABC transporter permease n=1 Tax=Bifidobacterium simiiventris TaxID=2834434 RepID=UPI001F17E0CA|nr:sugar ABC transporter permease [Bifidobacterium simiiventris]
MKRAQTRVGWLFSAAAIVIIGMFVFYPAFYALYMSFTNATGFNKPKFIGLQNYVKLFTNADAMRALANTAIYTVMYMPLLIIVALAVAMLLNRDDLPLRGFFRSAIFLPFVISMAVAAMAWQFILDPNLGFLPYWLSKIGIRMGDVLGSTTWALPTVTIVGIWKNFGYFMVIFLAGLQGVSHELYEAAELDGCGPWRKFTAVTLPGLRSTMTYVIIMALIQSFQAFDQIYVMTSGGPDHMTETVVYRIYTEGFRNFHLGSASALSYVLLIVTFIVGVIQLVINNRHEKEDL